MTANDQKKVIVGMSGGVDSSVSALLLLEQGYQVEGLFMKNWDEDDGSEYCTAKADLADAQKVCDKLGIPLHQANFASEYWDNVFEYFLAEYKAGRTPNPDVLCNREIKFKVFIDYAEILGCDLIATGHYARVRDAHLPEEGGEKKLLKGLDKNKDQSYFLHAVSSEQFSKVLFPVGEIEKPEVRDLAERYGLVTHNKKDSTGICFIGERRFSDFLQRYLPAQPGEIVTREDNGKERVLGQHQGLMYYTIGQRQGLGIGGLRNFTDDAWFVSEKNLSTKTLYVVQGTHHTDLFKSLLVCEQMHWINTPPELPLHCTAKTRYRQPDQRCNVELITSSNRYLVRFETPQRAITPGQYVVFYQDEVCLGGAVICAAANHEHEFSDMGIPNLC